MDSNYIVPTALWSKRVAPAIAAGLLAAGGMGAFAIHEHKAAQSAIQQRDQVTAALSQTRSQLDDLTAKVNALAVRPEPKPMEAPAPQTNLVRKPTAARQPSDSTRLKKMQAQLDAQNQAIAETRNDLDSTRSDLTSTRTELTGSIARTHDELVLLQKKGERNYYEFDIDKSKQFQREGPFGIRLRKANTKHQYADLELLVEDRNLTQKHVNLYQPIMFYTPDSPQPAELVINNVSKDHIHGYVSAPKYRQSELASAGNTAGAAQNTTSSSTAQPAQRQKLPAPQ